MPAARSIRLRGFRVHLTLWFGGLSLAVLLSVGYYLGRMATAELTQVRGEALYGRAQATALQLSNSLKEWELDRPAQPGAARGAWGLDESGRTGVAQPAPRDTA